MRLLGVKTGRKIFMNSTDMTEWDMVEIGDEAALNFESGPQTHLFEDRVMKKGTVTLEENCSVGAMSVILYNSCMHHNSRMEALSLLMKAESLAPDTSWQGIPARRTR
jgi:non-ribosomal peptide synthetase-like protein